MQGRGRPDLTPNNAPPSPASPGSAHLPSVNGLASAMAGDDVDAQSLASHMEQLARDPEAAARQMQLTARAVRQAELYRQKLETMVRKQNNERRRLEMQGNASPQVQRQQVAHEAADPEEEVIDGTESEYEEEGEEIDDDYIDDDEEEDEEEEDVEEEEEDDDEDDDGLINEDDPQMILHPTNAPLSPNHPDDEQEFLGRPLRPGETIEQYLEQQQRKAYEFLGSDPEARKAALQAVRDRRAMPPPPLPPAVPSAVPPAGEKTTARDAPGPRNGVNGHVR